MKETQKMKCGIYLIINIINFKSYVGQTKNYDKRILTHKRRMIHEDHKSYNRLYPAMRKHGINNFAIAFAENCNPDELNNRERAWIKELESYKNGYNATEGGDAGISYWIGKHRSAETKIKLSLANIGKKHSEETKNKISASNKGKHPICYCIGWNKGIPNTGFKKGYTPWNVGKPQTEETKRKQSESLKKTLAIKRERKLYVNK